MSGVEFPPTKQLKLSDLSAGERSEKEEKPLKYFDVVKIFNELPMCEKKKFNSAHFLGYENEILELEQKEVLAAWQYDSETAVMFPIILEAIFAMRVSRC